MRKLLLLAAAVAFAQRPWPPPGMTCPERTIVILQIGDASKIDRFYDEHLNYIRPLMKSGKIVASGPSEDGGGFSIFATTDWAEVEAIMKKEPFTREGITKVASHTVWRACEAAP